MTPGNPSDSEGAGSNPASVGRRRHTSSGQSQVRSLYDGLSHLYTDCDSRYVNGILLSKLVWPTVRKNCSSVWEKLLKFEAEGREFA